MLLVRWLPGLPFHGAGDSDIGNGAHLGQIFKQCFLEFATVEGKVFYSTKLTFASPKIKPERLKAMLFASDETEEHA